MATQWRYYRLAQGEHASPGSPRRQWRFMTHELVEGASGEEISEWASEGLRFYRTEDVHLYIVAVRSDLGLEGAARQVTERMGILGSVEQYPDSVGRNISVSPEGCEREAPRNKEATLLPLPLFR